MSSQPQAAVSFSSDNGKGRPERLHCRPLPLPWPPLGLRRIGEVIAGLQLERSERKEPNWEGKGKPERPTGSTSERRAPRVVASSVAHGCFGYPNYTWGPRQPSSLCRRWKGGSPFLLSPRSVVSAHSLPLFLLIHCDWVTSVPRMQAGRGKKRQEHLGRPMGLCTSCGAGP